MKYAIALVLALTLNATANLMMKAGARGLQSRGLSLEKGLMTAFNEHWILFLGLCCFATNVIFYVYALRGIKISVAYPIMFGGGFAIIALVAWRLFGEVLTSAQWVGVGFILVGLFLVARQMNAHVA